MNIYTPHPQAQQQVLQLDNRPTVDPAAHLVLRLRRGESPQVFDYRASIRQLGQLLKTYTKEACNDNISVQLRDWIYKITKLDLRDASKLKSALIEQLDLLAKRVLVNEFDQSPLREPVFLGERMGDLAEFVGEREMLEEYVQLMSVSTETLKVHSFATAVLSWVKPIAEWAKKIERHPGTALVAYQSPAAFQVGLNAGPSQMLPQGAYAMPFQLDPAAQAYLQDYLKQQKIRHYEQLISGGLSLQKLKRQCVEHRHAAELVSRQKELATCALEENLNQIASQLDKHRKDVDMAIGDLKGFHDREVSALNGRYEDLLKRQQETFDRLMAEEKRAEQLQGQVASLSSSLQSAWARVNQLSHDLANADGGFCVVQ